MKKIKETVVVEGKDDKSAVLAAVDANVICTSGFGLNDDIISLIESAYKETGIVIFTDPDHAGRKIRERLTELFPDAKQAYLTRSQSYKKGDIGIENALPEDILNALEAADASDRQKDIHISMEDLYALGLAGDIRSAEKRERVGAVLGIGYANTKTFLKRLRYMGITRERLEEAIKK